MSAIDKLSSTISRDTFEEEREATGENKIRNPASRFQAPTINKETPSAPHFPRSRAHTAGFPSLSLSVQKKREKKKKGTCSSSSIFNPGERNPHRWHSNFRKSPKSNGLTQVGSVPFVSTCFPPSLCVSREGAPPCPWI